MQPFDIEIAVSADIKSKTGVFTPQIGMEISALRIVLDAAQIESINQFLDLYIFASRRCRLLLKVSIPYVRESITPPYVSDMGGFHLLPSLCVNGLRYPDEIRLSRSDSTTSIVGFFRSKFQSWARELWKFTIGVIIEDQRLIRPLGRWIELIRLPLVRRKYAFYFSKLLKKSGENGDFLYDVKRVPDFNALSHIYALEMQLPISTILVFRSFGIMVAVVRDFNTQYRQSRRIPKGEPGADTSKLLQWHDIVEIHTDAIQTFRSMHRDNDAEGFDDDDDDDFDDSVSALTDEGSVYSYSKKTSRDISTSSIAKQLVSSLNIMGKAKSAFIIPTSVRKAALQGVDEQQETRSEASATSKSPINSESGRSVQFLPNTFGKLSMTSIPLGAGIKGLLKVTGETQIQSRNDIVQMVIRRHQSLITIIPPNLDLNLKSFDLSFRQPVAAGARKDVILLSLSVIKGVLSISSPMIGNNQGNLSVDRSLGGFASLAGALVQVTFSVESGQLKVFDSNMMTQVDRKLNTADLKSITESTIRGDDQIARNSTHALEEYYTIELDSSPQPSETQASSIALWSSIENRQFLVVCIVLDNDSKKRGAADVQIQFGETNVDLDGATVALFVDSNSCFTANTKRAITGLKETFKLLTAFNERALVVDMESKAPLGLLSIVSETEDILDSGAVNRKGYLITKADRKAVLAHMNYEYWLSFLYEQMPGVVTICFRINKVLIDLLSASSIKDVISSKAKLKADKAAAFNPLALGRRSRSYTDTRQKNKANVKGSLMKALNDIKKFGIRDAHDSEDINRMKVEINPIEVIFAKTNQAPYPMLTFDLAGGKVSIPIDDDTLCHALAMLLAKEVPMVS